MENQGPLKRKRRLTVSHKPQEGRMTYVVGKSGNGKTVFIKAFINKKLEMNPLLNVYHVDTKKKGDFSELDGSVILSETAPAVFTTPGNRMVWQPMHDDEKEYSKFFESILDAGLPAIVNIDECINMRFSGDRPPRGLSVLIVQGRLPGIHVIGGTQEVARSPRQLLSQAHLVVAFNVTNPYDTRQLLEVLNLSGKQKKLNLKKFEFFAIKPDEEYEPIKYTSYEQFINEVV